MNQFLNNLIDFASIRPKMALLGSATILIGVILVGATAGMKSVSAADDEEKKMRDETWANVQSKLPADCGFSDLGVYMPDRHTDIHIVMVRCEGSDPQILTKTSRK